MQSELHPLGQIASLRYAGTSQGTRLIAALELSAAPLDDRSEAELLAWVAEFSQSVNFFNSQNRIEGDWQPFFASEPIVQYAVIDQEHMNVRAAILQEQLHAWREPLTPENGFLAEGNLLTLLYDQCQRINGWHAFFSQRAEEHVFAGELVSAIELTMSKAINAAQHWEQSVARSRPDILSTFKLNNDLSSFDVALWRLGMGRPLGQDDLPSLLVAAHRAEAGLVSAARARLQVLLSAPSQLAPHFALFLAFLRQLNRYAQTQLNELTSDHLKLFYQTVLEEKPAAAVPDRAYVVLGMAPGAARFHLPAGTQMLAKGPAGTSLLYGLDEPVDMTGCSIAQILTVRKTPFSFLGEPPRTEFVLCSSTVSQTAPSWPMFGPVPAVPAPVFPPFEGGVGFALASSSLQLAGGQRDVTLTITFDHTDATAEKPPLVSGTVDSAELASGGLDLYYSGAAVWEKPTAAVSIKLDLSAPSKVVATLVIKLGAGEPPWVKFDPKLLQGTFDPSAAVFKILRREVKSPPCGSVLGSFFWLLESAKVCEMKLDVSVSNAPVMSLANGQGSIAKGVPILPFGNIPAQQTSFYISCPELQGKELQGVTLHLNWQNLPLDTALYPSGLVDYYKAYAGWLLALNSKLSPAPFSRAAYAVGIDCKVNGSWPLPNQPTSPKTSCLFPLFDPPTDLKDDGEAISPQTNFSSVPFQPGFDGSFRVQLQTPSYAFGHGIYPQVLASVAMQNAAAMMAQAKSGTDLVEAKSDSSTNSAVGVVLALHPLPPPPLTPALSAVSVSYRATASVSFAAEGGPDRCHQILPFATPQLLAQKGIIPPLVEPVVANGYLYLGLLNVTAEQKVSLLFVLEDQRADSCADAPQWSILCRAGWVTCTPNDQTYGLQKSGQVQLAIPADMDDQSPLMPQGPNGQRLCWLRIQTQKPDSFPAVMQILPQAGIVTFLPSLSNPTDQALAAEAHFSQPLAAGTLKALRVPDPRVKSILQPLPSFGGRAAETEPEFLVRVSERLRHKGRAWTAWDYERLLLQQFPSIYYARCLPHTCAPACAGVTDPARAPGHVLVVVLPLLPQAPSVLPPGFTAGELAEMQSWLCERASPAVTLRVCNPVYETLKLTIAATFEDTLLVAAMQAQLNSELCEFISPWIYQPKMLRELPPFEFQLAAIKAFILSRPYVKALSSCTYATTTEGCVQGDRIYPSHAWSMLVTAEQHEFTPPT
jgi:hypothetical protein